MEQKSPKYIFVTGGVVSSLGKGVAAASLGALLQSRGYTVHARKFDPYLNIDPGAMSPLQHGEVYVTTDGHETDLDLGYYERFLGVKLTRNDSVSGGRIYWDVLNAERRGEYGGGTVQMIPHVSNKIKEYISAPTGTDFVICEIGGTVGDIEGKIFLESARQFAFDIGRRNVMFVHLTLAPYLEKSGELKTKPTQMSTRALLENGIQADMLIVRAARMFDMAEREKIGMFCNLPARNVISGIDVDNIYQIPMVYEEQNVFAIMAEHFGLDNKPGDMSRFERIEKYLSNGLPSVTVGVVGKYFATPDSYKSLNEALLHAGIVNGVHVNIRKIDVKNFSPDQMMGLDGILMPGDFDDDIDNAQVAAAGYARANKIPYLGIGAGMRAIADAGSVKKCDRRIGSHVCKLCDGTLARKIYADNMVSERHKHRCGISAEFAKDGLWVSARSQSDDFAEIIEASDHPFFVATLFHPEYSSSPYTGHVLFNAFICAAKEK